MTSAANQLTAAASGADRRQQRSLTLPSIEFRVFLDAFGALGYDTYRLAAAAGVNRSDLSDPDMRVPCPAYGAVVREAMTIRHQPNLALHVAARIPIGAFPLLDYLVLTSHDVAAGLQQLSRYLQLVGSALDLEICDEGDPVRVVFVDRGGALPFVAEYTAALLVLHFRREAEGPLGVPILHFVHRLDDGEEFERILGCRVRSPAPWPGVTLSRAACALPMRRRDPVLARLLESQAKGLLTQANSSLVSGVRQMLASSAAREADVRMSVIARRLAMSARTLQRRLAAEGWSYHRLLDDWRKDAAARHVGQSGLGLSEIAYLLGYSEPPPFHRAFKRWFGTTPHAFRQRQQPR
jgi:AraC-like DNA-binding protein